MSGNLFNAHEFGGITFKSTNHSLKAEKILLEADIDLIVIPTPREISTSCGLTIKLFPDDLTKSIELLKNNQIQIAATYLIKKQGKNNLVEKWPQAQ